MFAAENVLSHIQTCWTHILFSVNVPVLSEQIIVHAPSASIASKFFTRHFFLTILLAVRVKDAVTVGCKPENIKISLYKQIYLYRVFRFTFSINK